MGIEQATKIVGPSFGRSVLEGLDGVLHLVAPLVAFLIFTHEQLDVRVAKGLGDLMNGAARLSGRAGVEAGLECSTALSVRQLAKPYSRAMSSWASACF